MNRVICELYVLNLLLYPLKLTFLVTFLHTLIAFSNSDSVSFSRKTQAYKIKISKQFTLKIRLYLNLNTSLFPFLHRNEKLAG